MTVEYVHQMKQGIFCIKCSSSFFNIFTAIGSTPLLSIMWKEDNLVNVSCESEGWYPEPVLRWSDKTKDLTHKHPMNSMVSSGLYSVHSWLIVPGSSEVSCSVGLSQDKEVQEARLLIADPALSGQSKRISSMCATVVSNLTPPLTLRAEKQGFLIFIQIQGPPQKGGWLLGYSYS